MNDKNSFLQQVKLNPKDRLDVVVGDDKEPDIILPQAKLQRWDNEANCSIRLKDFDEYSVIEDKEKVIFGNEKKELHLYNIEPNKEHPEGAYEIEVILNEKPVSNVVEFTLSDKDVEYLYQPPLTQEEIDKGSVRPENVVGSYAVYAKSNKVNYVDGKEYKCGKVGHIFRPKIIDSVGTEVWGELKIENGTLSVTIPQDFLDKAVYPIRHAAGLTFGFITEGGTNTLADSNTNGTRGTPSAGSGTSMSVYCNYNPGGLLLALWDSSKNTIANGSTGSSASTGNPLTINFSSSPTITAQNYYVGVIFTGGVGALYYDTATNLGWNSSGTSYANLGSPDVNNNKWSVYCTYTAGGGGAAANVSWRNLLGVGQ
jgi:hypothetical protein